MRCGEAVGVDRHRRRLLLRGAFVVVAVVVVVVVVLVRVQRRGHRDERVGDVAAQGGDVRAHRVREAEVELQRVVDRVEVARRDEVEVLAFGIPGRRAILAQRLGRIDQRAALAVGDAHDRRARFRRPHVGEPAAVGREREIDAAPGLARVEQSRLAAEVEHEQFVPVVGERQPIAARRGDEFGDASDIGRSSRRPAARSGRPARRRCARTPPRRRRTRRACRRAATRRTPARAASSRAVLADRRFPQRHRVGVAARNERQRFAVG